MTMQRTSCPTLIDTKAVTENLFTNEDPYHVHKTLGFLSVLSFVVRLCFVGERDMGFQSFPMLTLPTIVLHMTLGLSSLLFKIPGKRISEGNRIWPQFRLHSICFVGRHSLLILLYWAEQHIFHCEPVYWANCAIVFLNFICVDAVNANVQNRSNSVRDLQAHPGAKYFFTVRQFIATANCLAGIRRASLHYYIILVMQLTAFFATLRRKNIIVSARGRRALVFGYGAVLAIGAVLAVFEYVVHATLHEFALITAVARSVHLIRVGGPEWLGILRSKYILWGVAAIFLNLARSSGPNLHPFGVWLAEEPQSRIVRVISVGLWALQVVHGVVVTKRQLLEQQASAPKTKLLESAPPIPKDKKGTTLIDSTAVKEKLFTNEDPYHVHKTLGFLSILSFLVRLCFIGERDMGFQSLPMLTLPTTVLHMTLGLSSLLFKIPGKRISEGNRIWPQFRLHSICFVGRHSLLILLYGAEQHVFHCEPVYWANGAIVFLNFICVDAVNANVKNRSNTIRELQAHPGAKYFFTAMQFAATTHCLAGTRRASLHYYVVLVMQFSAFLATLRRKNIVVGVRGQRTLVFGYGAMLAIALVLGLCDYAVHSTLHELALLAAVARSVHLIRVGGPEWLGILRSKYILWGVAAIFLNLARSSGPNLHPFGVWLAEEPQSRIVRVISVGLWALQVVHGVVVTKRQLFEQQSSAPKTKLLESAPPIPKDKKGTTLIDSTAVKEKLFTNEDPYHVHKTLGFLSILSFLVRLCFIGERDMGFQSLPMLTLPTTVLHMTLGLSSLLFKIPGKRISEGNRIWPQFRLHSICFVGRHSLLILLYGAEQHVFHCEPVYWANGAIVFLNFICVDGVNANVKNQSNSVRDLQAHPGAKYFFTAMQFAATTQCLAGIRRASLHYYIILVMQLTAFFATLRRKNIIVSARGRRALVFGYGAMLAIGVVLAVFEYVVHSNLHELALLAAVTRSVHLIRVGGPEWLGMLRSKYILWGVAAIFLNRARSSGPNPPAFGVWLSQQPQSGVLGTISLGLLAWQIGYGFVIANRQLKEQEATIAKIKAT